MNFYPDPGASTENYIVSDLNIFL